VASDSSIGWDARASASIRPLLLADGYSAAEAEAAARFTSTVNAFGRGDLPWEEYERELDAARAARWFERVEKPTSREAPSTDFYRTKLGRYLDPLPPWSRLRVPILAIYGALDTTVPAEANATPLARALGDSPGAASSSFPARTTRCYARGLAATTSSSL
jgi:pimeloyl-ACP methyl ester carboxylesterase